MRIETVSDARSTDAYMRRFPARGVYLALWGADLSGCTDVQIQEMLAAQGIYLPVELLSVNDRGSWTLCLTPDVLSDVVNWLCQDATLAGKQVRFKPLSR